MSDAGAMLKRACDLVLSDPTLQPEYDDKGKLLVTHCNQGVRLVAQAMGCREFDDPSSTADRILSIIMVNASKRWRMASGPDATIHALSGGFSIAGMSSKDLGEAHGHVAVVYPVGMQASKAAGHDVPVVANVGPGDPNAGLVPIPGRPGLRTRPNWICSAAWAFPVHRCGEPPYYIWTPEE